MKPTTVLLDAGGVILDETEHEAIIAQCIVETLSHAITDYSLESYWADIEEAVACYCPQAYQYVFWKRLKPDRTRHDRLYSSFREAWKRRKPSLTAMPGIEREIRALAAHFKIGIAGQYGRELLTTLEKASLIDCFTHRFTQDDFTLTKPDPRYFEQIAKACGADPAECIMAGDRIDKDIIPAKQAGMGTILIRVGLHKKQQPRVPSESPDRELTGIAGLAEAVIHLAGEGTR